MACSWENTYIQIHMILDGIKSPGFLRDMTQINAANGLLTKLYNQPPKKKRKPLQDAQTIDDSLTADVNNPIRLIYLLYGPHNE